MGAGGSVNPIAYGFQHQAIGPCAFWRRVELAVKHGFADRDTTKIELEGLTWRECWQVFFRSRLQQHAVDILLPCVGAIGWHSSQTQLARTGEHASEFEVALRIDRRPLLDAFAVFVVQGDNQPRPQKGLVYVAVDEGRSSQGQTSPGVWVLGV